MGEKKRRSEMKRERLVRLMRAHHRLNPLATCEFLCPLCLGEFEFDDAEGATEAHIIPKAASGRMTTFLCKHCNSAAGATIDKWFGEHVRLKEGRHDIFDTKFKTGRVNVSGLDFGGDVRKSENGGLEVFLFNNQSNPANFSALEDLSSSSGIRKVEFKFPLLAKRRETRIGALQTAYLWLVNLFGYVPVYQGSLDQVRKQLLRPDADILCVFRSIVTAHFGKA